MKVGVDCANGAYSEIAPRAFEQLGAKVTTIGAEPDGTNINKGYGATDLRALQQAVTSNSLDLGVAFDGDGDRMLAVDENGAVVDGDHIVAILALHPGVELVAVTVMSNLGLLRLLDERGIRWSRLPSATATCSGLREHDGCSAASSPGTSSTTRSRDG